MCVILASRPFMDRFVHNGAVARAISASSVFMDTFHKYLVRAAP